MHFRSDIYARRDRLAVNDSQRGLCWWRRRRPANVCVERNRNVFGICYGLAVESKLRFCDCWNTDDVRDIHAFQFDSLGGYGHCRDVHRNERRGFLRYRRDVW